MMGAQGLLIRNIFTWPRIRLIQRLSILLTVCCGAYVLSFLFSHGHDNLISENRLDTMKNTGFILPLPVLSLKPYDVSANGARDIFFPDSSGTVTSILKGQLPEHLKIVGILIGYPSEIIIEDTLVHQTFFINEGNPQAGIKIVRVSKDQMIINYQGQEIPVPIRKN